LTGGGADACLLVATVEGQWDEDVAMLEKESYHEGVLGLQGAAHVGKSRTAWSNVNENQSRAAKRKKGQGLAYHIPSTWGKGGQAIFEDEPPFYLYIQDPAKVRLVFTVMDDDIVGGGDPVGSAHRRFTELIPKASMNGQKLIEVMKQAVLEKVQRGEIKDINNLKPEDLPSLAEEWEGEIKLTSKPRIKDKNSQITMGAAAGAMVGGPVGAAAGAFLGSMYEGQVRGRVQMKLKYLPMPPIDVARKRYIVKGGLPGVDWGNMYEKFLGRQNSNVQNEDQKVIPRTGRDLEHCFFIKHEETGGCCAVYRSLEQKLVVVSFRGTCELKDIVTDASLAQTSWIEGEEIKDANIMKAHVGFRKSMNSIARRLKELVLATPAPGEDISQYDMIVTGHSLGGALATLFTLDIGEYGIDAGRALPQKAPSEAWWKSISNTLSGNQAKEQSKDPPRPKSLKMYNFGSPRVGNDILSDKFSELLEIGHVDEAYRIVNGEDLVARNPRTVNALAFGNVGYEHCGPTVLVSVTKTIEEDGKEIVAPTLWIEGESDDEQCPVRDGTPLTSPLANGSLLGDIVDARKKAFKGNEEDKIDYAKGLQLFASQVTDRIKTAKVSDITASLGIDSKFAERELRMMQSIAAGEALAHHMEDEYYASMGRASGFIAEVGEDLVEIEV